MQRAERARAVALVLLATLALDVVLVLLQAAARPVTLALTMLFLLVPLLLPLSGLVRRRRRTYAWATLCLTPHFVYALTELIASPALRLHAGAMLVLSLALMVALVAYLRLTRPQAA
ncbi:MAG: putative rane protein [Steroidobacteraceae bacterium]|nr:putative rane protein [Steroidobacteraceae bacterium]